MIRKSRMVVALGLVTAVSGSALAFADGAGDADARVLGKVNPSKLDKKEYKSVELYTEVQTDLTVNGSQQNPEVEFIEFGKNVKFDYSKATLCTAVINGTTSDQAKAACPPKSNIGTGTATVKLNESTTVSDEVVTAFAGPEKNQIRLHAYSPTLQASNTQVVQGLIVKAKTPGYGQALSVLDAPDAGGDAFAIASFGATITKASKVVLARCKAGKFLWKRNVTYDDGSTESVIAEQKCKVKK